MFRNQYDNDVTVFSPQGRLFQVEYAQEAVKQGAPCVGIISEKYAVLAGLKRTPGDLSASTTKKIFSVAPHVGCAIAGLTSDARVLTKTMHKEAHGELIELERRLPVKKLIKSVALERAQQSTQYYGGRPFGVGLLVVGVDEEGTHLYEFSPSGTCLEYTAWGIGARSQSAKTYFEGQLPDLDDPLNDNPFGGSSLDCLIDHALKALRECLPPSSELELVNTSVGVVGIDKDFEILSDNDVKAYLDKLPPRQAAPTGSTADEPMASPTGSVEVI